MGSKNRFNGEGSVYQTKVNGSTQWCAQSTVWLPDGRRTYVRGYGATPTQALARREENRKKRAITGEAVVERSLRDAVEHWFLMSNNVQEAKIRVRKNIENWIYPAFGKDIKLVELTETKLKKFFDEFPGGPAAKKNVYYALSAVLTVSMKKKWITVHPIKTIRLETYVPAVSSDDNKYAERRSNLYYRCLGRLREQKSIDYYWLLFFSLGLRKSELAGIEWDSFTHLGKSTASLVIDRQFRISPSRIEKGDKTGAERRIPLAPLYRQAMKEWRDLWVEPAEEWAKNQVFTFQHQDGTWHGRIGNRVWSEWKRVLREYVGEEKFPEYDFRLHGLRHVSASTLAEDGVPLHVAQAILGHFSEEMTKHYTHIYRAQKEEAIDSVSRRIENNGRKTPKSGV